MDSDLYEFLENLDTVSTIFDVNNHRRPKIYRKRPNYFESFDETDFFRRYRLSKSSVLYLLEKIEHALEFPDNRNNSISPINQLLMTLRFYATGSHLLAVADMGGISVATCSRIIKRVSAAIWIPVEEPFVDSLFKSYDKRSAEIQRGSHKNQECGRKTIWSLKTTFQAV
ncbi:unnamed protein product [Colias eurytheme]|nr:unnamed protein product [Colias eurytheme]